MNIVFNIYSQVEEWAEFAYNRSNIFHSTLSE